MAHTAINILRAADPEFGEEELPRGGKVETIVKDAVDRHGDTAYLGIICAMARIAIGELCQSADARGIEFEVNLDKI